MESPPAVAVQAAPPDMSVDLSELANAEMKRVAKCLESTGVFELVECDKMTVQTEGLGRTTLSTRSAAFVTGISGGVKCMQLS